MDWPAPSGVQLDRRTRPTGKQYRARCSGRYPDGDPCVQRAPGWRDKDTARSAEHLTARGWSLLPDPVDPTDQRHPGQRPTPKTRAYCPEHIPTEEEH